MRLPDNTQRLVIVGRTGTGKTQGAVWHLSHMPWSTMPWIIFDWKRDKLIARLPTKEIPLGFVPEEPGLYVVHPLPDQQEDVDAYLWALWARENVGLYVDEGYMLDKSKAFRAIQTQGRSKHIPTIVLSQRPNNLDRFIFSEADFYQIYALNDLNDRKRVAEWMPLEDERGYAFNSKYKLPKYHSWYYDVSNNELVILNPVPKAEDIIARFYPSPDEEVVPENIHRVRVI